MKTKTNFNRLISLIVVAALLLSLFSGVTLGTQSVFAEEIVDGDIVATTEPDVTTEPDEVTSSDEVDVTEPAAATFTLTATSAGDGDVFLDGNYLTTYISDDESTVSGPYENKTDIYGAVEIETVLNGAGTYANPFLISSVEDLYLINLLEENNTDGNAYYFKQTANIDMSDIEDLTLDDISYLHYQEEYYYITETFHGVYDGGGYTISNMTKPFFYNIEGGSWIGVNDDSVLDFYDPETEDAFDIVSAGIKNLTITNSTIKDIPSDVNSGYTSTIAIHAYDTAIVNVDLTNVEVSGISGEVAGLVDFSYQHLIIEDCDLSSVTLTSESSKVAGVVNVANGQTVIYDVDLDSNCVISSPSIGTSIVRRTYCASIEECQSGASITAKYAGGLVGYAYYLLDIASCDFSGSLSFYDTTASGYAGGAVYSVDTCEFTIDCDIANATLPSQDYEKEQYVGKVVGVVDDSYIYNLDFSTESYVGSYSYAAGTNILTLSGDSIIVSGTEVPLTSETELIITLPETVDIQLVIEEGVKIKSITATNYIYVYNYSNSGVDITAEGNVYIRENSGTLGNIESKTGLVYVGVSGDLLGEYGNTGTIGDINSTTFTTIASNTGTIGDINSTTSTGVTSNTGTIGDINSTTSTGVTLNTGTIGDINSTTSITVTSNTGTIGGINSTTATTVTSNTGTIGDITAGTSVTVGESKQEATEDVNNDGKLDEHDILYGNHSGGEIGDIVANGGEVTIYKNAGTIGDLTSATSTITIGQNSDLYKYNSNSGTIGSLDAAKSIVIYADSSSGSIATGKNEDDTAQSITFVTSITIGSTNVSNGNAIGNISYAKGTSASASINIYNGTGSIGDIIVNYSYAITIVKNDGTIGDVTNETANVTVTSNTGTIGDITAGTSVTVGESKQEATEDVNNDDKLDEHDILYGNHSGGEIGDITANGGAVTIYKNAGTIGDLTSATSTITIGQNSDSYKYNSNSGTIGSLDAAKSIAIYAYDSDGSIATGTGESIKAGTTVTIGSTVVTNNNSIGTIASCTTASGYSSTGVTALSGSNNVVIDSSNSYTHTAGGVLTVSLDGDDIVLKYTGGDDIKTFETAKDSGIYLNITTAEVTSLTVDTGVIINNIVATSKVTGISNSGTISGISSSITVTVAENSGKIGTISSSGGTVTVSSNVGTIENIKYTGTSSYGISVTNSGEITGEIYRSGTTGGITIVNNSGGIISGNITQAGTGAITITNNGTISGDITQGIGLLTLKSTSTAYGSYTENCNITTEGSLTIGTSIGENSAGSAISVTLQDGATITANGEYSFYLKVFGDAETIYVNTTASTSGTNTVDVSGLSNLTKVSGSIGGGTAIEKGTTVTTTTSGTTIVRIGKDTTYIGDTIQGNANFTFTADSTLTIGDKLSAVVIDGTLYLFGTNKTMMLTNYGDIKEVVCTTTGLLTIENYGTIGNITSAGAVTVSVNEGSIDDEKNVSKASIGSIVSGTTVTITNSNEYARIAMDNGESITSGTSTTITSNSGEVGDITAGTTVTVGTKDQTAENPDYGNHSGGEIGEIVANGGAVTIYKNAGTIGDLTSTTAKIIIGQDSDSYKYNSNSGTIGSLDAATTIEIYADSSSGSIATGKNEDDTAQSITFVTSITIGSTSVSNGNAIGNISYAEDTSSSTASNIYNGEASIGNITVNTSVAMTIVANAGIIKNVTNKTANVMVTANTNTIGDITAGTSIIVGASATGLGNSGTIGSLDAGTYIAIYAASEAGTIAKGTDASITFVRYIDIGSSDAPNGNKIGDISRKEETSSTSDNDIYNGTYGEIGNITVNSTSDITIFSNEGTIGDVTNETLSVIVTANTDAIGDITSGTSTTITSNSGEVGDITAGTSVTVGTKDQAAENPDYGNHSGGEIGDIVANGGAVTIYKNAGTIGDLTSTTAKIIIGQDSDSYKYNSNSGTIGSLDAATTIEIYADSSSGSIATGKNEDDTAQSITFVTSIDIGSSTVMNGNKIGNISYKEGTSSSTDNDIYNGEDGEIGNITVNSSSDIIIVKNAGKIGNVTNENSYVYVGAASMTEGENGNYAGAVIGNLYSGMSDVAVRKNDGTIGDLTTGSGVIAIGQNNSVYTLFNNNSGIIGNIYTVEGVVLTSLTLANTSTGSYESLPDLSNLETLAIYLVDESVDYELGDVGDATVTITNQATGTPTINLTSGGNVTNTAYTDEDGNVYYAKVYLTSDVAEGSTARITGAFESVYLTGEGTTVSSSSSNVIGTVIKVNPLAGYYTLGSDGMVVEVSEDISISTSIQEGSEDVVGVYLTSDGVGHEGTITIFTSEGEIADTSFDVSIPEGEYVTYLTDITFTEPDFYDGVTITAVYVENGFVTNITHEFSTIVKETAVETYVYDGEEKAYDDLGGKYTLKYYQGTTLKTNPTAAGSYDVTIFNMADTSSYYKIEGGLVIEAADTLEISAENALMFVGSNYAAEVTGEYGDDVIDVSYVDSEIGAIDDFTALEAGTYEITVYATNANYQTVSKTVKVELVEQYTVDFNTNNASVSATTESTTTQLDGTLSELPTISDSNEDYIFLGWYTASENGDLVTTAKVYDDNTTLYAHWEDILEAQTYSLIFDSNAGGDTVTGTMNAQTIIGGISIQVSANTFVREGYTFLGWSENSSDTSASVTDQATYAVGSSIESNVNLYAIWEEKDTVLITGTANERVSYDGSAKAYEITGDDSEIGFDITYYEADTENVVVDPTNVGSYDVVITRAEDSGYKAYTIKIDSGLVIAQVTDAIESVSIVGWTYGDTAIEPVSVVKYGASPVYQYKVYGAEDTTYSNDVPEDAGSYVVKATVVTDNYTGEATDDFTIAKATPVAPTGLYATVGDTLSNVELQAGWTWDAEDTTVINIGTTYTASYAGDANYIAVASENVGMTVYAAVDSSDEVSADDLADAYETISSISAENSAYSDAIEAIVSTASSEAEIVEIAELLENMVTSETSTMTTAEYLTYGNSNTLASATATVTVDEDEENTTSITIKTTASDASDILVIPGVVSSATEAIETDMAGSGLTDVNGNPIDLSKFEITTFDYTIKVVTESGESAITQITIDYEGVEGGEYYVAHVTSAGAVEYLPGTYDHTAKTLTFTTTSCSPFVALAIPTSSSSSSSASSTVKIDPSYTVGGSGSSSSTEEETETETPDVTVAPSATETPTATVAPTTPDTADDATSSNTWIWIVLGVLVIGGIVGFVIYKKKQK